MQAMFSTSFGPTPPAHPCRPLAKTPNPATKAPYRNDRRLTDAIMAKFSSVSLECPIATRHSFNDQMGEAYGCILWKPFPIPLPARHDANIKQNRKHVLAPDNDREYTRRYQTRMLATVPWRFLEWSYLRFASWVCSIRCPMLGWLLIHDAESRATRFSRQREPGARRPQDLGQNSIQKCINR